jgi:hypothetical protein
LLRLITVDKRVGKATANNICCGIDVIVQQLNYMAPNIALSFSLANIDFAANIV